MKMSKNNGLGTFPANKIHTHTDLS